MILLAILACIAAVGVILALLPVWSPVDLSAAVDALSSGPASQIFAGLGWLNNYLPVDVMLVLLTLQVQIWLGVKVVQFVIWLLQLFHIAGGGD